MKQDAEIARNLTELSNNKVALIDPQILGRSVENIAVNTMNASVALDTSEANCRLMHLGIVKRNVVWPIQL